MQNCNICFKEFTLWKRLTRKDEKHYLECEKKLQDERLEHARAIREHVLSMPPKERYYFSKPTPPRRITPLRPDYSEPNFPVSSNNTGSDFLTGAIVGGVVGAVVSDWVDSPSEPKFEGSGGTFGGGGATGSWEDSSDKTSSSSSSCETSSNSCDSSDSSSSSDSGSCSSD